jgi:hypothetical protein
VRVFGTALDFWPSASQGEVPFFNPVMRLLSPESHRANDRCPLNYNSGFAFTPPFRRT